MEILRLLHDDNHKRKLFGWIGEACTDAAAHKALGGPIHSAPGDIWFLAIEDNELRGFCALRLLASRKSAKLHALYTFDTPAKVKADMQLRKAATEEAKARKTEEVTTVDWTERRKAYEAQGWEIAGQRGKNFFVYRKVF